MPLRSPVLDPTFAVTRLSHVVLTGRDLDASRRFYCDVLGLFATAQEPDALYLRGLEEAGHHSLVIRLAPGPPACVAVGYRVLSEDHLDRAKSDFDRRGVPAEWVESAH